MCGCVSCGGRAVGLDSSTRCITLCSDIWSRWVSRVLLGYKIKKHHIQTCPSSNVDPENGLKGADGGRRGPTGADGAGRGRNHRQRQQTFTHLRTPLTYLSISRLGGWSVTHLKLTITLVRLCMFVRAAPGFLEKHSPLLKRQFT